MKSGHTESLTSSSISLAFREQTFATVKLRTAKTRGCLSRQTMLTMVFKLCQDAEKRWRRLQSYRRLGEVIENVKFVNGVREDEILVLTNQLLAEIL